VTAILTVSVLVISYLLRIFEIKYYRAIGYNDFEQFISPIWAVVITMGTVGYGDVIPVSPFGRFIMMVTSIWGAFMFSLVLVAFSMIFNLTPHQKKAMHHLLLTRKAASTIAFAFRYFSARKKSKDINQNNPDFEEIFQRKISFSHID
jgi:Ion channel